MASTLIQGFDFGAMERELQGRQKVVVSKGTLAKVSREHTQMLKSLMMDVALNKAALAKIKDDWAIVDDLQQRVTSLEGQLAEAQETIRQQQETLDKQAEILEYGKRMEVIQQDLDRVRCVALRWVASLHAHAAIRTPSSYPRAFPPIACLCIFSHFHPAVQRVRAVPLSLPLPLSPSCCGGADQL